MQYLSSLNTGGYSRGNKSTLSRAKTRSHSVPHFNQLKSATAESVAAEPSSNEDQNTESASGQQQDSNSLDDRSTHSVDQQQTHATGQDQVPDLSMNEQSQLLISPILDGGLSVDFENITDDEKRQMNIASVSNKTNQSG